MKQVTQNFKTGELLVAEAPPPSLAPGFVLVQNHFSLISAGTERSTVSAGRASFLGKARQRPDLVKQVLDSLRTDGLAETMKRVRTKLETLKELGYSSAGIVLASMDTDGRFQPGDRVACGGGGYASHAGVVSVPQNLVVKLPDTVGLDAGAFTTLGAIALQGVRQADPKIGELVCVIGLGLLGQITARILRVNGCQVFGVDTDKSMVELAEGTSCHAARSRWEPSLSSAITGFTKGYGFDAVIITAGTQSPDPVELATAILRQKGVMVVVGAVPMNVPREPHFYRKELELKISCSYGPGRYDRGYEEESHDYPYGYVRWTENRNMEAFAKLLEHRQIDVCPLITHVFAIDQAENAYDLITGKAEEPHLGILLRYCDTPETPSIPKPRPQNTARKDALGIGFIGAGSFAQKFLIPFARKEGDLLSVVTARGITAMSIGRKFGFRAHSTDPQDVFLDPGIDTVFIATRHDTHASLVVAALEAGKNVFVEKPLALREPDLARIERVANEQCGCRLMVGYNRRFSPLAREAKKILHRQVGPMLINYRVNAGFLPKEHWAQTEQGGGRILGEVCHFVDLMQYLSGSDPTLAYAVSVANDNAQMPNEDNVVISLRFANGSIGQITYVASGDKSLAKERLEIFFDGQVFILDDFKAAEHYRNGTHRRIKGQGKGHKEEVDAFLRATREGRSSPIPLDSLIMTSLTTFAILDSLHTGLPQAITSARLGQSAISPSLHGSAASILDHASAPHPSPA